MVSKITKRLILKLFLYSIIVVLMMGHAPVAHALILNSPNLPIRVPGKKGIDYECLYRDPTLLPSPELHFLTAICRSRAFQSSVEPRVVHVPVLLYHHVLQEPLSKRYTIDAQSFSEQMLHLSKLGFKTIDTMQLRDAILTHSHLPPKPVILTFDDGYADTYKIAFPIMQKFGFKGTVYVVAERLGVEGFLSIGQLKELVAAGWEIGSHSMTHIDLSTMSVNNLHEEILESRLFLKEQLGIEIRTFAYPYGITDADIRNRVAQYGYLTGMGIGISKRRDNRALLYLSRMPIDETTLEDDLIAYLNPTLYDEPYQQDPLHHGSAVRLEIYKWQLLGIVLESIENTH